MFEWKIRLYKFLGKKRHTAHVLLEKDDKYLLVQEATNRVRGLWGLPGGGVEKNESVELTAEREAEEETGFDVKLIRKLGEISDKKRGSVRHIFQGEIMGGELKIDTTEHMDARWFRKADLREIDVRGDWVHEAINLV